MNRKTGWCNFGAALALLATGAACTDQSNGLRGAAVSQEEAAGVDAAADTAAIVDGAPVTEGDVASVEADPALAAANAAVPAQLVPGVPKCRDKNWTTVLIGKKDNFGNGSDGAKPQSPALIALFASTSPLYPQMGFDAPSGTGDKWFGTSFTLKRCLVCDAEVRLGVRANASLNGNDYVHIGAVPWGTPAWTKVHSGAIWGNIEQTIGTLKTYQALGLAANLNALIFNAPYPGPMLDVAVQDDTAVDWVEFRYKY